MNDLVAMARRVIDANHYLTLATLDPDGRPRVSPVFYTAARYTDLYWVSAADAHHSRNLAQRPRAEIVIFDSTAPVGRGEAVYLSVLARPVPEDELDAACAESFGAITGAHRFTPAELRGRLRLYVARVVSSEVHVPGSLPVHGRGVDSRQPVELTGRG